MKVHKSDDILVRNNEIQMGPLLASVSVCTRVYLPTHKCTNTHTYTKLNTKQNTFLKGEGSLFYNLLYKSHFEMRISLNKYI